MIHLCGKGNLDPALQGTSNYIAFEYVTDELPHLLKIANYVISRAGSNSIFEFLELKKPMLLNSFVYSCKQGRSSIKCKLFQKNGLCNCIRRRKFNGKDIYPICYGASFKIKKK